MKIRIQFHSWFCHLLLLCMMILFPAKNQAEQKFLFRTVNIKNGLPDNFIINMTSDSIGRVHIATKRGVVRFDGRHAYPVADNVVKSNRFLTELQTHASQQHESSKKTFLDSKGCLWIYDSFDYGLECHQSGRRILETSIIKTITETPDGKLWIATNNDGVAVLDPETFTLSHLRHDPSFPLSLPSNHITSLYVDTLTNSIWVGTTESGVGIASLSTLDISIHTLDIKHDISSFARSPEGRLLIGFDGGGLYDTGYGSLKVPSEIVTNILAVTDTDTSLIATYGSGLFELRGNNISPVSQCGKKSPVAFARQMLADSTGSLWIGTFSAGICRLDKSGHLSQFTIHNSPIGSDCIVGLEAHGDSVYIASTKAICVVSPGQDSLHKLPVSVPDDIRTFAIDKSGRKWIATKNTLYTPGEDSIPIPDIKGMTTDAENRCWITGSQALYVVETDSLVKRNSFPSRCKIFPDIIHSDFSKYALRYIPEANRVFAGFFGGYLSFDPNSVAIETKVPISIADISINGKTHHLENTITLLPGDTICLTLCSADYAFPDNDRRAYQLLPDTTLHLVEDNRIVLTDQPPGLYTLRLIDLNSDSISELKIIWKRSWQWLWIIIAVIIMIGGGYLIFRLAAFRGRHVDLDILSAKDSEDGKRVGSYIPENDSIDNDPVADRETDAAAEQVAVISPEKCDTDTNEMPDSTSEKRSPADKDFLAKVDAIIEREYANQEFSVEDFASEIGMSRSSLYKKLSQLTGLSPIEYLRYRRIQEGKKKLDEGHTAISQIAYSVGLSPKQFSKFFKDAFGVLPSEYMKK